MALPQNFPNLYLVHHPAHVMCKSVRMNSMVIFGRFFCFVFQLKAAEGYTYSKEESIELETELVKEREERRVVTMQLQALDEEKGLLGQELSEAYIKHREEMEIQQLQNFQVN